MSKKILTKEEFFDYYYENKKLPHPLINWGNKKLFNDNQLNTKYKEYLKKFEKTPKTTKVNLTKDACSQCHSNDDKSIFSNWYNKCSPIEKRTLTSKMKGELGQKWDAAHIISRSESIKLSDDIENLVLIPHLIHLEIDNFIDPRTGKRLTQEEHEDLWISIVGEEKYLRLLKKKRDY